MKYIIKKMDPKIAEKISRWQYMEPYSIYSFDGSKETINEFMNGSYFSVQQKDKIVGYFCFGESAQVPTGNQVEAYQNQNLLDIGLGLRPELTGQGYGSNFLRYGLDYAVDIFSKKDFRLTVAQFNKRAIKVYRKIGFKDTGLRFKGKDGEVEFIIMILKNWE